MAGGELDAKVWSELPREVLDLVLRCLPISTLCKFRAVCKHWNTLPTVRAEDPYLLYIPRFVGLSDLGSCSLYSLSRSKWEVLDLSFVASFTAAHFYAQEPYRLVPYVARFCSHGGLLCLMGIFVDRHSGARQRHPHFFSLVCNPLTRTLKLLPNFECYHIVDLVMHRDSSGVYKIFAAAVTYTGGPGFLLHFYMYDSDSELWKRIFTLKRDRGDINLLRPCSAVFNDVYYFSFAFGGILKDIYSPSGGEGRQPFELHAYDMKQGSWVVTGVKMGLDDSNITSVSFVVANERLLLSATSPRKVTWFYRLDGSEEMKLSDTIVWKTACAYQGSIILASHASLMMVEPADANAMKPMSVMPVPSCNHPDCNTCEAWTRFNVNMAKVSFNVQVTL